MLKLERPYRSKLHHFHINGGHERRNNFPNIMQAAESRAGLRIFFITQCCQMNGVYLRCSVGGSYPWKAQHSVQAMPFSLVEVNIQSKRPQHFAPGKPAQWRMKEKNSSPQFPAYWSSLTFWLGELSCRQDRCLLLNQRLEKLNWVVVIIHGKKKKMCLLLEKKVLHYKNNLWSLKLDILNSRKKINYSHVF